MIQKIEDIIKRFCEYGMEYKDHEGYTHDWITLLPAVQLAYNTRKHFTTGKSPSLLIKGWNPLLPVDHLRKNLLTIHPTAKDLHDMWKRACDTAAKCIAEAKEYNKKIRDSFVGPFTIVKLIEKNAVEVRITEEFSRKRPVFPVTLVKPYFQKGEDKFPSRTKTATPPEIVELKVFPRPVKKIIKSRKIGLNGKYQRQYLVRLKNHTADKEKWFSEDAIPDGNILL
ncbi:hypothetical protein O181_043619 [Austropuccinia psidii MF-1]|uniref:Integrase catalytic domain-containing protein n=1 Tax=Austropuccinia psidii MF-1 TaxID=1389203 RepID=A0A9Q3HIL3_9BASI|nr:hypothetical protein [Austropuccinia psidii MF-1]